MFKKVQNYLLINQPLLWNTKLVWISILAFAVHIIFFLIGFGQGSIDFTETRTDYNSSTFNDGIIIFFSVLVSILLIILWLVNYFKNNALKSFYPKKNHSLFSEWIIQFFVCFLLITLSSSFFIGKDFKLRSYFSKEETLRRCTILSMGSYFVDNSFSSNLQKDQYNSNNASELAVFEQNSNPIDSSNVEYVEFNNQKFNQNSLINRDLNSYSVLNYDQDSIHKHQIRMWLVKNQKNKITNLFKDYLKIAKEHNLKANISAQDWTKLIYNYPNFTKFKRIGKEEKSEYYFDETQTQQEFDSSNYYIVTIDNIQYIANKFYVPETQLSFAYTKISDSYEKPFLDWGKLLLYLYVALGISLSLFSFRVTSGKSWLIALVSFGIFNIVSGIFSAFFGNAFVYLILTMALTIFTFIYLHYIIKNNQGKKISGISNVLLVSLTPVILPVVVGFYSLMITSSSNYYATDITARNNEFPLLTFIHDNTQLLLTLNLVFVFFMQLYYSKMLKIWRGIAED